MNRAVLLVGLIVLCPVAHAGEATDRDNVVILLDGSGSMNEPLGRQVKIVAAKQAIVEVLQTVPRLMGGGDPNDRNDASHQDGGHAVGGRVFAPCGLDGASQVT